MEGGEFFLPTKKETSFQQKRKMRCLAREARVIRGEEERTSLRGEKKIPFYHKSRVSRRTTTCEQREKTQGTVSLRVVRRKGERRERSCRSPEKTCQMGCSRRGGNRGDAVHRRRDGRKESPLIGGQQKKKKKKDGKIQKKKKVWAPERKKAGGLAGGKKGGG